MSSGLVNARLVAYLGSLLLASVATQGFVAPCSLQARARTAPGRQRRGGRSLSMIVPGPESGYNTEEWEDFPDYVPNMGWFGEAKQGATPEASPPYALRLDTFHHGGVDEIEFHDLPDVIDIHFVGMNKFIEQEGLAMLPSETEIMEQEVKVERQKRAQARKERYPDEQEEDLVDDTLDDVPVGTNVDAAVLPADGPPPPVDFDDNDGYDDGYDTSADSSSIADSESSTLF